jgi:chromosome segregation ATPase
MRSMVTAVIVTATACVPMSSCKTVYYGTMESLGQHKRDILVDRVESARDDQEEAKEQFRSALDSFSEVVAFDGGDLRANYDRLKDELGRAESKARRVSGRIEAIEEVAAALFEEWEGELDQYASDDLRQRSEDKLNETKTRYGQLIAVMKRAEQKMEPVLVAFRDQVLFLKHNLNAQAVASLQGNVESLQAEIAELVAEMEAAIAEANAFIESMGSPPA